MANTTYPSVEQIIEKHQRGETLTPWETSVYRLNVRNDGTRYSADPKVREAQYDADNAETQARRVKRGA